MSDARKYRLDNTPEERQASFKLANEMMQHFNGQDVAISISAMSDLLGMFAVNLAGGHHNKDAVMTNIKTLSLHAAGKAAAYIEAVKAKDGKLN